MAVGHSWWNGQKFPQEFGEQIEEFGLRLREFRGLCHRQGPGILGDPRGGSQGGILGDGGGSMTIMTWQVIRYLIKNHDHTTVLEWFQVQKPKQKIRNDI